MNKAEQVALKAITDAPNGFNWKLASLNGGYTALNCLPCVPGSRWVVSEDMYDEQLGCLPPLRLPAECVSQPFVKNSGYAISEAETGNIRSAYYKTANGLYWHEYVILPHED